MEPIKLPCYCGSLRQASRVVTQIYDQELKPSGLKITQFGILHLLVARPGLTTGTMAATLAMDSTTLTRTLKIMQDNGWIAARSGTDRRERHWEVTAAGKERGEQAIPLWRQAQRRLTELTEGLDLDQMNRALFELARRVTQSTVEESA
jgi:DNA-binding MarR family transcriptional regulator